MSEIDTEGAESRDLFRALFPKTINSRDWRGASPAAAKMWTTLLGGEFGCPIPGLFVVRGGPASLAEAAGLRVTADAAADLWQGLEDSGLLGPRESRFVEWPVIFLGGYFVDFIRRISASRLGPWRHFWMAIPDGWAKDRVWEFVDAYFEKLDRENGADPRDARSSRQLAFRRACVDPRRPIPEPASVPDLASEPFEAA